MKNNDLPVWRWISVLLALVLVSCATRQTVHVSSLPAGGRILIDGHDSGLTTPSDVELSTKQDTYVITIERQGYNPSIREVRHGRDVDVIEPEEVVARVCCAPCCLGMTLPGLLKPLRVKDRFVPSHIHANLLPEGQGLKLTLTPEDTEIYVNGRLQRPLDGYLLILDPGDHEIEVRKRGYRSFVRVVHIEEKIYQSLDVELAIEGQGLLLTVEQDGAKVYVDEQYQGTVTANEQRRLRTTPGPHSIEVRLDGYESWKDVVTVDEEDYRPMSISLNLEGQGIIVKKTSRPLDPSTGGRDLC